MVSYDTVMMLWMHLNCKCVEVQTDCQIQYISYVSVSQKQSATPTVHPPVCFLSIMWLVQGLYHLHSFNNVVGGALPSNALLKTTAFT